MRRRAACWRTARWSPGPDRAVFRTSLLPWLTVYENVKLGVDKVFASSKTRVERDAWVMHNLNLVQIPTKDKRPSEISGGMKQRVGLRVRFYGAECCCSTSP